MKIVANFEIPFFQILNERSELVDELPAFAKDTNHLLKLYRLMVLVRMFDTKAIALQRTGKLGTYPSARGQEAAFVGMGDAMAKTDVLVPYYRDVGSLIQRGVQLKEILMYWGGDERGNAFECQSEDFSFSVPIATQLLHAAGVATAFRIKNQKRAVLTTCGDGGTSEGDFYEALNIAGIWRLPLVIVICNNQWAISVPLKAQTAAQTLAQKAIAAGLSGEQVDGNDILAVRDRVAKALDNARNNHQPHLIEILSYRHADHTTADDASRYEPKNLRETEWVKEPIIRLRRYLENHSLWSQAQEEDLLKECSKEIEQTVDAYVNIKPQRPEDIFNHLYADLPDAYLDQVGQIIETGVAGHG